MATPALVAAETQPSARARLFGSVESATYAWTTPTVPPPAPWTIREMKSMTREPAYANMTYETADAPRAMSNAGRRPYRSENLPHNGADSRVASENADTSNV